MNNSSAWYGVLLLSAVLGFGWIFITSVVLTAHACEPSGRAEREP